LKQRLPQGSRCAFFRTQAASNPVETLLMNAVAITQPAPVQPKFIAPVWHTLLYLLILAGLAVWGAQRHGLPQFAGSTRTTSYLITIACEWLLAGFAVWGVRMGGVSVRTLIGGRWSKPTLFLRDLGLAVLFLIGSNIVLILLTAVLRPGPNANISRMLPRSATEILLWILLSLSAGICEELTTRGYLQKQLSGLLKNGTAGLFAQGIIFGVAHAYQGPKHILTIAVLGCMLGWLAQWQQSLRPGMISHFLQDVFGGLMQGAH
jgi:membrane protease YdiL (CAAX protease family)